MTVVYRVSGTALEDAEYLPTLAGAIGRARTMSADGEEATVTEVTVAPFRSRRELFCALLNGERYAKRQEKILLFRNRRRVPL